MLASFQNTPPTLLNFLLIYSYRFTQAVICRLKQWLSKFSEHHSPVFLPGKSHGWKSLVGYSPWGRKELDTTERLTSLHSHLEVLWHLRLMEAWGRRLGWIFIFLTSSQVMLKLLVFGQHSSRDPGVDYSERVLTSLPAFNFIVVHAFTLLQSPFKKQKVRSFENINQDYFIPLLAAIMWLYTSVRMIPKLLKMVKKALRGTSKIMLSHYTQRMVISVLHPGKNNRVPWDQRKLDSKSPAGSGSQKSHKANKMPTRYVVNFISVPTFGRKSLSKNICKPSQALCRKYLNFGQAYPYNIITLFPIHILPPHCPFFCACFILYLGGILGLLIHQ